MAIETDLAPFHFDSAEFDGLIDDHGVAGSLRQSRRCSCWDLRTGQPDPACACFPFGYIWDETPIAVVVWGPNRKILRRYEQQGKVDLGDVFFTFKTGQPVMHYARLTVPITTIEVDDILTKGSQDTIRFAHVVQVRRADYTVRNPTSGAPYTIDHVSLSIEGLGTPPPVDPDIRVTGRVVTFLKGTPADGTRYTLRLETYAEYVVWEPQDRAEGNLAMPYRYLCKRLDFLLHPRAGQSADYAA